MVDLVRKKATASGSGEVKGGEIPGQTSGAEIAAGYVGERITTASAITTTSIGTSDQDINNASITLTAGTWMIYYSGSLEYITAATIGAYGYVTLFITDSSNNHLLNSERLISGKSATAASNTVGGTITFCDVVNISSTTTYKLRGKRTDNVGVNSANLYVSASAYNASFYAVRIA